MKQARCVFEERIERASRSGQWSDELLAHAAGCQTCEEAALVASYLCESRRASSGDAALPDAGRIWWKAQLSANAAAVERALRPIVWARRFAFGAFAALVVAATILWWPQIVGIGGNFTEMWTRHSATHSAGQNNFVLLGTGAFLALLVPLIFGLYAVWSED